MGKTCKGCREPYRGAPVYPSDWGFLKREAYSHCTDDAIGNRCYCSEKCRAEAEGGQGSGRGGDEEYESEGESSSSSSGSGFANSFMGNVIAGAVLILLLIIVIGIIFGKNENPNDPAVKMEKWHEHLEKRRAAFVEGLSEEGVEARGFKNYTWEEWQAREKKSRENSSEKEVKKDAKWQWVVK